MLQSMTGYANKEVEINGESYEIEIKSLNSKHCDIYLKIPDFLNSREIEIRNLLKHKLQRGKINLYMKQVTSDQKSSYTINQGVVKQYINELSKLEDSKGSDSLISIAMNLPDSITESKSQETNEHIDELIDQLNDVINNMILSRKKEGELLETDIKNSIEIISKSLVNIENYDKKRIDNLQNRLREKLEELKAEVDENRYEQEILYYTEKLDINEELVRLKIHLKEFEGSLNHKGMTGKKLGFIGQEMGREINTIGSKANDSHIQHQVITMKEELEKIKEQTLNVF